ncbi:hypothetical protein BKA93DRAFT_324779 [Sparassis latifolia]
MLSERETCRKRGDERTSTRFAGAKTVLVVVAGQGADEAESRVPQIYRITDECGKKWVLARPRPFQASERMLSVDTFQPTSTTERPLQQRRKSLSHGWCIVSLSVPLWTWRLTDGEDQVERVDRHRRASKRTQLQIGNLARAAVRSDTEVCQTQPINNFSQNGHPPKAVSRRHVQNCENGYVPAFQKQPLSDCPALRKFRFPHLMSHGHGSLFSDWPLSPCCTIATGTRSQSHRLQSESGNFRRKQWLSQVDAFPTEHPTSIGGIPQRKDMNKNFC